MDFGMATPETAALLSDFAQKSNNNPKNHGYDPDPFLRTSKAARTDPFSKRSETMLSVSSTNITQNGNQRPLFSFCRPPPGNAGCGSGGGMHVPVSRCKGPFTPSQWMELQHQALIYKYIVANVPVPSHLLNPIRNSLHPFLFSGSSSTSNSYGWGAFHLDFSGNTDPEPGRCRRTDGKKWRCSKDAVPDQKYCERHINRGRHRSRKLVEGKMGPVVSSSSCSAGAGAGAGAGAIGGGIHDQVKILQPQNTAINPFTGTLTNRSQDSQKTSYLYRKNCDSYLDQDAHNQNPLHCFMEERPKGQLDGTSVAWHQEPTPDWTPLSMSLAPSDFSSQEKLTIAHKQASSTVPISWQNSVGGPLGEVLKTSTSGENSKKASTTVPSHMTDICSVGNHPSWCSYSPTGVLQKDTSISLSNSSGNSPRGNKDNLNGNEKLL